MRRKAARLVAAKCALAARVDASHESVTGETGLRFKEEIEKKLDKLQEPPPVKFAKPLPKPIEVSKKKRGGKRVRKMKERYAMTEFRKQANRLNFGDVILHNEKQNRIFLVCPLTPRSTFDFRSKKTHTKMTWATRGARSARREPVAFVFRRSTRRRRCASARRCRRTSRSSRCTAAARRSASRYLAQHPVSRSRRSRASKSSIRRRPNAPPTQTRNTSPTRLASYRLEN